MPPDQIALLVAVLVACRPAKMHPLGAPGADAFAPLGLAARGVDLALLPYWYLVNPELRRVVRREMLPAEILVLHTPAPCNESAFAKSKGGWDAVMREIQADFPNAHAAGPEHTTFVLR